MKKFLDTLIQKGEITVDNSEQNKDYLRQAYIYAKEHSDYDSTWTGAIIEKNGQILSFGTNKLPEGFKTEQKVLKGSKLENKLEHAERNAIYNAAKKGIILDGTTMYMPWVPCLPCSRGIIFSGIKKLVMHYSKIIKTPESRVGDVKDAVEWLFENNIELVIVNEKISGCESKLRGKIWNP